MGSHQRGLTLLELLVTISVAGVLIGFGVPSFINQYKNGQLTSAVNLLVTAMHISRSEASKRGTPVIMCTSNNAMNAGNESCTGGDWTDGWIVFADNDGDGTYGTGDQIVQTQNSLKGGLTVIADDDVEENITYLPTGFAALPVVGGDARFIVFCGADGDDRYSRVLSLSNNGRPRVLNRNDFGVAAPSCATS
ncbi:MAG: GspH/FimT family pseudopilin [Pseudomonadota bacterium]